MLVLLINSLSLESFPIAGTIVVIARRRVNNEWFILDKPLETIYLLNIDIS